MSLGSPRRIFRRTSTSGGTRLLRMRSWLAVPVVLLSAASFSVLMLPTGRVALPADVDTTLMAGPAQVEVVDGDTLRLRDTVIRLLGVTAPARGAGCGVAGRGAGERGVEGRGVDCGQAATVILAGLVSHGPVECRLAGSDDHGRPLGTCRSGGVEINSAVVESGWAVADPGQPALDRAERSAQAQRRGLWAQSLTRP